jgi:hypothetical protein
MQITPSHKTLACLPSKAFITADHVYRTTGLDRLKKDAYTDCL